MATANLHETIQASIMRKAQLQLEISELQGQKTLASYSQVDLQQILSSEKNGIRNYFKDLYNDDATLQQEYLNYTEIPDFEEEIDRITALYQEQMEEMAAWEVQLDAQITTNSTELEELTAYIQSYKQMLSTNIQEDYNFGLNS